MCVWGGCPVERHGSPRPPAPAAAGLSWIDAHLIKMQQLNMLNPKTSSAARPVAAMGARQMRFSTSDLASLATIWFAACSTRIHQGTCGQLHQGPDVVGVPLCGCADVAPRHPCTHRNELEARDARQQVVDRGEEHICNPAHPQGDAEAFFAARHLGPLLHCDYVSMTAPACPACRHGTCWPGTGEEDGITSRAAQRQSCGQRQCH